MKVIILYEGVSDRTRQIEVGLSVKLIVVGSKQSVSVIIIILIGILKVEEEIMVYCNWAF